MLLLFAAVLSYHPEFREQSVIILLPPLLLTGPETEPSATVQLMSPSVLISDPHAHGGVVVES